MNSFSEIAWSKVQCEMILAFLSFADYFRPKYVLLENVGNFVSFNKGQAFRLSLASLLEMGYQVGGSVNFSLFNSGHRLLKRCAYMMHLERSKTRMYFTYAYISYVYR